MIDKSQIVISANLKTDVWGNLFTINRLSASDMVDAVVECWQYRQRYFNDKIFSIPIPATKNGKPAIHTVVVEIAKRAFNFGSQMADKSPLDENATVIRSVMSAPIQVAKFVDIVIKDISTNEKTLFEIINLKGVPRIDVPPHPYEIARNVKSKDMCQFTYSVSDIANSIEFWAHHDFAIKAV